MSKITEDMLDKMQKLSNIELDINERKIVKKDMEAILDFIDILGEACDDKVIEDIKDKDINDDNAIESMMEISCFSNGFREDIVSNATDENIINNAPNCKDGYIIVPKTVN